MVDSKERDDMDPWIIVWLAGAPPMAVLLALWSLYDWHKGCWKDRSKIEVMDWIAGVINCAALAFFWPGFLIMGLSALMILAGYGVVQGARYLMNGGKKPTRHSRSFRSGH